MGYYTLDQETFEHYEKLIIQLDDWKDEVPNPGSWDYNFIEDIAEKLRKYERSINLSLKQQEHLRRIHELWEPMIS